MKRLYSILGISLLALLLGSFLAETTLAQALGETARERQAEMAAAESETPLAEKIGGVVSSIKVLAGLVLLLVFILVNRIIALTNFRPFAKWETNKLNPALLLLTLIIGGGVLVWEFFVHGARVLPPAASEHGVAIDRMMMITIVITLIVFIGTHIMLFGFSYLYRNRPGQKAIYYHDNTKLEMIWTTIPAIVLAVLVLFGVQAWTDYHKPVDESALKVNFLAEQFRWNIRYAGEDNQLGEYNYLNLTENNFGLDSTDSRAVDDRFTTLPELHLPVGKPVEITVNSKDVLHGFYAPHFRSQVYAVPGMPTKVSFVPTTTTAQMREELNNPEFEYEIACSQICGASHWNMRVKVVVESEDEYKTWLADQTRFIPLEAESAPADSLAPADPQPTDDDELASGKAKNDVGLNS